MKPLTGNEMCRLLERGGLAIAARGSHHVYGKAGERAQLSVSVHGNDKLKVGLQAHLLSLAGIEDLGS